MGHGDHLLRDTDLWEDGMRFDPLLAWKALEPPWLYSGQDLAFTMCVSPQPFLPSGESILGAGIPVNFF